MPHRMCYLPSYAWHASVGSRAHPLKKNSKRQMEAALHARLIIRPYRNASTLGRQHCARNRIRYIVPPLQTTSTTTTTTKDGQQCELLNAMMRRLPACAFTGPIMRHAANRHTLRVRATIHISRKSVQSVHSNQTHVIEWRSHRVHTKQNKFQIIRRDKYTFNFWDNFSEENKI